MGVRSQDTNFNKNNFAEFAARKRAARRWMEFEDMIQMSEELVRSNEYNSDFKKQILRDGETLFINKKTSERFILLEPRMIGAGYEKNLTNTIESLKLQGFGGKITFIAPANRNNSHWVMGCGVLNLDNGKVESETKIDSFADGRQTDGFSCGVHTMEAAAELIKIGLSDYMKLYKSRVAKKNGVNQTATSSTPVKSEEQKNTELLKKLNITKEDQIKLISSGIEISLIKEMYALTKDLKSDVERIKKTRELLNLDVEKHESRRIFQATQVQQNPKSVVDIPKKVEKPVKVSKDELVKKAKTIKEHQSVFARVVSFFISLLKSNRFSLLHNRRKRLTGRNDSGISI